MMSEDAKYEREERAKVISMEAAISETLSPIIPHSDKLPLDTLDITRVVAMMNALDTYRLTHNSEFFQFRNLSGDALLHLKGQYLKSLEDGRNDLPTSKESLMHDSDYDDHLEQLTSIVSTIRKIDMELTIRTLAGYAGEPIRREGK